MARDFRVRGLEGSLQDGFHGAEAGASALALFSAPLPALKLWRHRPTLLLPSSHRRRRSVAGTALPQVPIVIPWGNAWLRPGANIPLRENPASSWL